jgi:hypothetical protein
MPRALVQVDVVKTVGCLTGLLAFFLLVGFAFRCQAPPIPEPSAPTLAQAQAMTYLAFMRAHGMRDVVAGAAIAESDPDILNVTLTEAGAAAPADEQIQALNEMMLGWQQFHETGGTRRAVQIFAPTGEFIASADQSGLHQWH